MLKRKKAQSSLEYALIIAASVAGLLAMGTYLKNSIQGRLKVSGEQISERQFEPKRFNIEWERNGGVASIDGPVLGDDIPDLPPIPPAPEPTVPEPPTITRACPTIESIDRLFELSLWLWWWYVKNPETRRFDYSPFLDWWSNAPDGLRDPVGRYPWIDDPEYQWLFENDCEKLYEWIYDLDKNSCPS